MQSHTATAGDELSAGKDRDLSVHPDVALSVDTTDAQHVQVEP